MRNTVTFIVAIVLLIVLLLYSITYQVRFDQVAVVTRFGRAGEGSVRNASADAADSGLHFKLPYPIDAVRTYDKRVQVLEDRPEEQQTRDNVSVVVQSYLAWQVTNPLDFYRTLGSVDEAEKQLRSKLRDARKIIGDSYTFEDLTNTDPTKLRLAELEDAILKRLQEELAAARQPYGVELKSVGIKRILLAPKTTEEVFNRMKSTRQRMATGTLQEGESIAKRIRSEAESTSNTILSFAERRATNIRSLGEAEATKYLAVFGQDENFAIQQRKLDTYRAIFADAAEGKTTFIIDAQTESLFKDLFEPPGSSPETVPATAPAAPAPAAAAPSPATAK